MSCLLLQGRLLRFCKRKKPIFRATALKVQGHSLVRFPFETRRRWNRLRSCTLPLISSSFSHRFSHGCPKVCSTGYLFLGIRQRSALWGNEIARVWGQQDQAHGFSAGLLRTLLCQCFAHSLGNEGGTAVLPSAGHHGTCSSRDAVPSWCLRTHPGKCCIVFRGFPKR